jgi:hypothetical protein
VSAAAPSRGAIAALREAPAGEDSLSAALRELLPERSAEEKVNGEVLIGLGTGKGRKTLRVPVLFARPNRAWKEQFVAALKGVIAGLEADASGNAVLALLNGMTDVQLVLLEAYEPKTLAREWVEEHATEEQILDAFLRVTAAAFPLPARLAQLVFGSQELQRFVRLLYLRSMTSSPPSTDGAPAPSKTH